MEMTRREFCVVMAAAQAMAAAPSFGGAAGGGKKRWYKGNMHCHTYWSDGRAFPDQAIRSYRDAGFDFCAVTDHNRMGENRDFWRKVEPTEGGWPPLVCRKNFDIYRKEFPWAEFRETRRALQFQSSNNLSTFLMIALPIGFLYSKKYRALIFLPVVTYVALLFCDSRGGIFLGTLEFFFLLVFFCFYRSDRFRRAFFIGYFLLTVGLVILFLPRVLTFYSFDTKIEGFSDLSIPQLLKEAIKAVIDNGEARVGLVGRSFGDFKKNPLFGVGLGYTGNEDLYTPVKGAMNWYHMWAPQIWGSLGIVGILCFGYQLFLRLRLAFTRREEPEVTLSLCYLGLFMMSQVNPGEFCPFPYAIIATVIFLFLDNAKPSRKRSTDQPQKRPAEETPTA